MASLSDNVVIAAIQTIGFCIAILCVRRRRTRVKPENGSRQSPTIEKSPKPTDET